MQSEERIDNPTPHGGAYSIAYYRSRSGRPVDKARAARIEIVEFDSRGEAIYRTTMVRPWWKWPWF